MVASASSLKGRCLQTANQVAHRLRGRDSSRCSSASSCLSCWGSTKPFHAPNVARRICSRFSGVKAGCRRGRLAGERRARSLPAYSSRSGPVRLTSLTRRETSGMVVASMGCACSAIIIHLRYYYTMEQHGLCIGGQKRLCPSDLISASPDGSGLQTICRGGASGAGAQRGL